MTDCSHTRMITLSRQLGSGGESIARATADALGFRYLDSEIITRAAEEAGASEAVMTQSEHIPSLRQRMLAALAGNPGLSAAGWFQPAQAAPGLFMTSALYRRFIEDVVRDVAAEGQAVILGHGGQALLRDRWDTLKVLVTGSPERRALRVQGMLETHDHDLAEKTLCEWDAGRRTFYDHAYHIDWLSPLNYDLCLNTDHMTEAEAIETVVEAARRR